MGSYNAACAISNLSISCGDKVVFIPLMPGVYAQDKPMRPASLLIYCNALLNPFCLPIKGEYNDYGGVENIEEDDNTEAVSTFFNCSIDTVLDIVNDCRSVSSYIGTMFQTYAMEKDAVKEYSIKFGHEYLLAMGFVELGCGEWYDYKYKDMPCLVKLTKAKEGPHTPKDTMSYVIMDVNDKVYKGDCHDAKESIQKDYFGLTNYHINVKPENQKRVRILSKMSGMFVLRDVYDAMITDEADVDDSMYYDPKKEYVAYSEHLKELAELKKQAGDAKEKKKVKHTELVDIINNAVTSGDIDVLDTLFDKYLTVSWKTMDMPFRQIFKDWRYFQDIYNDPIAEGKLGKAFIEWIRFHAVCFSSNNFFFPSMPGEQCGNDSVSSFINNVIASILKKRRITDTDWRDCVTTPAGEEICAGDVVVTTDAQHFVLHCGSGIYTHAVVMDIDPVVLVSETGDMVWSALGEHELRYLKPIGLATQETLTVCNNRIARDKELQEQRDKVE